MFNKNVLTDEQGYLTLEGYKVIFEAIVSLSCDADGFGLYDTITEEDVEKCKWIAAMYAVMDDVPKRRMQHIMDYKKVQYDPEQFLEENNC